ncbi:MAG: relaxase domain-containing protein [Acidimicrobiales bacterium]
MSSTDAPTGAFLDAVKVHSEWRIARGEVERLLAARNEPQVVIGYVATCSTAKSLSTVWATGAAEAQALCEQAFEASVTEAVDYVESRARSPGRAGSPSSPLLRPS